MNCFVNRSIYCSGKRESQNEDKDGLTRLHPIIPANFSNR